MKTYQTLPLLAALTFFAAGAVYAGAGHDHASDHKPAHGGVLAMTGGHMDMELVARPEVVQLYVRDEGKPVDVTKASARLTLLTGAEKQEVPLAPAGDRLESKGSYKIGAGTKAVAVVNFPGKPAITARFVLK